MTFMDPAEMDTEVDQEDLFQDLPKIESVTAAQGIFPEFMFFWRRRQRKPEAVS